MRTHFVPLLIARASFDNTIITIRRTAVDMPVRPDTVTRQAYFSANAVLVSASEEYGNTLQTFAEQLLGASPRKEIVPLPGAREGGVFVSTPAARHGQPGRANAVVMLSLSDASDHGS
jgi:hypothetical protein